MVDTFDIFSLLALIEGGARGGSKQTEIFIHRSPKVLPKHNIPVYRLFTVHRIQS